MKAPVVVFAYKRPDLLKRTLETLAVNHGIAETPVYIFVDGPKQDASVKELSSIQAVREISSSFHSGQSLTTQFRESNHGLADSVLTGVDQVIERYGKVIVVEDDVELSPWFLEFMNAALDRFEQEKQIGSVGSWNYFSPPEKTPHTFFLRYPDSIAWATWKDRWDLLERNGLKLKEQLHSAKLMNRLDADGNVDWFSTMLQSQIDGKVDSWAIRWTATMILQKRLCVYPQVSLSRHMGFDQSATHENSVDDYNKNLKLAEQSPRLPDQVRGEDEFAIQNWISFNRKHFQGSNSFKSKVYRLLPASFKQWYRRNLKASGIGPEKFEGSPVSRSFGIDRGTPVDRYYIEKFLRENKNCIGGDGLEVGETRYLDLLGGKNMHSAKAFLFQSDANANAVTGDLTKRNDLPENIADVFICTQTLNFIYELNEAVKGIQKILKPGGCALVTVAGLCQISRYDADRWGDFWRFTPQSAERIFTEVFAKENVEVSVFGNAYSAHCLLHGFSLEECKNEMLDHSDPDYPVVIGLKIMKR